jgi:xylose dehydrogenase (NAD/NADP)
MTILDFLDGFNRRDWQAAEPADGPVRLAMVGIGWWTREQAIPAVEDSALCETTVAVSGDRGKAEAVVAEAETVTRGITYDEFVSGEATEAYDAVYVCTPNALHLPYAEAAAEHGKHVLCEKPMEASVERAAAMVEACDDAGVRLMVGYRMQTEPAVRRARELVRGGFVGEPAHVSGHMSQRLLEVIPNPDQWRLDPDLAGPGTSVTDLGVYPINTARFVLDADPIAASASMRSSAEAFDRVPDERASFEVEYGSGRGDRVLASFAASQNANRSSSFSVLGTEGEITLQPAFAMEARRALTVSRGTTSAEFAFDPVDEMTEEFDYFADRILTGNEIVPDGEHGLVDVRTIEAVYEAAERGERVEL